MHQAAATSGALLGKQVFPWGLDALLVNFNLHY